MIVLVAITLAAAEPLTLARALEVARLHQPQLRAAKSATAAAAARADMARAPLLPQLTASAAYQRTTANYVARPGSLPQQFTQMTPQDSSRSFDFYSAGLGVTQLVYDFGQTTGAWHSAKANAAAQAANEEATRLQIELDVRVAYFNARAQRALVEVARATLVNTERHLAQIESFVKVGRRPEIDLAQAQTDRANATVLLINAENDYATAQAQLRNAMGVDERLDYDLVDTAPPALPEEDSAGMLLVDAALRQRPEAIALERQALAQDLTLGAALGGYGPSLSLAGNLSDAGPVLDELAWNWNAGVQLSWPIFSGGLTWAQTREARANLNATRAQQETLRQTITLEVEQARMALRAAKVALEATAQAVASARKQLTLAEARYDTGVGNAIELGDAQLAVTNAAAQEIQAEFKLALARAQLQRSIGQR